MPVSGLQEHGQDPAERLLNITVNTDLKIQSLSCEIVKSQHTVDAEERFLKPEPLRNASCYICS